MVAVPSESQGSGDNELLDAVRHGSTDAYAELYDRHGGAAYSMARQVAKSPSEADDLVSETFAKVLDALRSGGGPTSAFRAYLLTSLRHTAYDRTRRDKKLQLSEDVTAVPGVDGGEPFVDPAVTGLERSLAAQAFARLPERWQAVLWHIEIEGQKPADVAPLLGLTPNGVSALAYRAREGLRQAYLRVHLGQLADTGPGVEQCRATVERLGSWTRGGLAKRETAQVESHLDGCERCRTLAAELADVNGGLRAVVAPLVLGVGAAGYLAATQGSTTLAGLAAGAAGGSGAANTARELGSTATRQILTAAASGVALVTAVALGAISGEQPQPSAQPAPEPVQPAPAPAPQPQLPPAPPPEQQPPGPPPQSPPAGQPPPQAPAPNPPAPQPPAPAPAPQPPEPASLNVSGPSEAVQLVAGESEKPMPVRVTNTGGSESEPVTASLSLPPGITASVPQVRAASGPSIQCDGGDGAITCTTDRGLDPGSAVEFGFVVRADHDAEDGEVTGTVSTGTGSELSLTAIPVTVLPQPTDEVDVRASVGWIAGPFGRVDVEMTNTGTTSAPAEVVAKVPEGLRVLGSDGCRTSQGEVRCSRDQLPPGEELERNLTVTTLPGGEQDRRQVRPAVSGWPPERTFTIPVSGALGSATDTTSADMTLWGPWLPPDEQSTPPPAPMSDPTTTTDPNTTSDPTTTPEPTSPPDPTTSSPDPTTTTEPTSPDPTTSDPTTTPPDPTPSDPPDPTTTPPTTTPPTTKPPTTSPPGEPTTGRPTEPTTSQGTPPPSGTGAPTTGTNGVGSTGDAPTPRGTPGTG